MPRTLENTRVPDETIVLPDDEEVLQDEKTDELSTYFDRKIIPKVLILSVRKPSSSTHLLMKELNTCVPNSEVHERKGVDLKKLIPQAIARDFTDVLVVNEDRKVPNGLLLIHLPEGPTAHFKLTSFIRGYDIKVMVSRTLLHKVTLANSSHSSLHTHTHAHRVMVNQPPTTLK